jgi:kynurenine formamidase
MTEGAASLGTADGGDALAAARAAVGRLRVHDASATIEPSMPMWFMFEAPRISPLQSHEKEGVAANSLTIAEHTGTHVDAPFHFDAGGATMDRVPAGALLLRPYKKYDLSRGGHQAGDLIGLEHLRAAEAEAGFALQAGDVAVVEVGWDRHLEGPGADPAWWGRNQPGLSEEACRYLADAGVAAVASDTAACDVACKEGEIVSAHGHTAHFLHRGILILEGLRGLAGVAATGLFLALPLKIRGGSGSPVRVLLLMT